jgi:UDP-N-acetyl-D-glucosamine dehydrogenase
VIHLLERRGALITYSDPYIPRVAVDGLDLTAVPHEAAVSEADCVVIITDHRVFDYAALVERAALVVDSRNALKGFTSERIVRL